jgi:hypothetical protein
MLVYQLYENTGFESTPSTLLHLSLKRELLEEIKTKLEAIVIIAKQATEAFDRYEKENPVILPEYPFDYKDRAAWAGTVKARSLILKEYYSTLHDRISKQLGIPVEEYYDLLHKSTFTYEIIEQELLE